MPAPAIITVVLIVLGYGAFAIWALRRPAKLGPHERAQR